MERVVARRYAGREIGNVDRMVVWRRDDVVGLGVVGLVRTEDGFRLEGYEVTDSGGLRFEVLVDQAWVTRTVLVESLGEGGVGQVRLDAEDGRWEVDGVHAPELDGCVDVDLYCVPVTNTLPIRRLSLADGEHADVRAVWVGWPELDLEVLEQRYTRVQTEPDGSIRYDYQVLGSAGSSWMTVDEQGLVIDYEDFATRITSE